MMCRLVPWTRNPGKMFSVSSPRPPPNDTPCQQNGAHAAMAAASVVLSPLKEKLLVFWRHFSIYADSSSISHQILTMDSLFNAGRWIFKYRFTMGHPDKFVRSSNLLKRVCLKDSISVWQLSKENLYPRRQFGNSAQLETPGCRWKSGP